MKIQTRNCKKSRASSGFLGLAPWVLGKCSCIIPHFLWVTDVYLSSPMMDGLLWHFAWMTLEKEDYSYKRFIGSSYSPNIVTSTHSESIIMCPDPADQQKGKENVSVSPKTEKEYGTSFPQDAITNAIFSFVFPLLQGNCFWKAAKPLCAGKVQGSPT